MCKYFIEFVLINQSSEGTAITVVRIQNSQHNYGNNFEYLQPYKMFAFCLGLETERFQMFMTQHRGFNSE